HSRGDIRAALIYNEIADHRHMIRMLIVSRANDAEGARLIGVERDGLRLTFPNHILDVVSFDNERMLSAVYAMELKCHLLPLLGIYGARVEPVHIVLLS